MQTLATRFSEGHEEIIEATIDEPSVNMDEIELKELLNAGEYAGAFFLSRRLITRGEEWAKNYLELAQDGLDSDDDVTIP